MNAILNLVLTTLKIRTLEIRCLEKQTQFQIRFLKKPNLYVQKTEAIPKEAL